MLFSLAYRRAASRCSSLYGAIKQKKHRNLDTLCIKIVVLLWRRKRDLNLQSKPTCGARLCLRRKSRLASRRPLRQRFLPLSATGGGRNLSPRRFPALGFKLIAKNKATAFLQLLYLCDCYKIDTHSKRSKFGCLIFEFQISSDVQLRY